MVLEIIDQFGPALLGGSFGVIGTLTGAYVQDKFQRQRIMEEEVYSPLMDELYNLERLREFPYQSKEHFFQSYWKQTERIWKYRIPGELVKQLTLYREHIQSLNVIFENIAEEIVSGLEGTSLLKKEPTGEGWLLENRILNQKRGNDRRYVPLVQWLRQYRADFMHNPDRPNFESQLYQTASQIGPSYETALQEFSEEDIEILWRAKTSVEENDILFSDYEDMGQMGQGIVQDARNLQARLAEETEAPSFL